MKLNWGERWAVNNPLRLVEQRIEIRRLKTMGSLPPGGRVLEIGCGRGVGAGLILKEFHPSRIHAMDLDIDMIRKAKKRLTVREQEKISLFVGNAESLPLPAGSFEAVYGFGVLHHLPDWRAGVREIARVLKPGGIYFLEELYPPLYQNFLTRHILLHPREDRFLGADLRKGLEDAGLPLRDCRESPRLGILGIAVKEQEPLR